jgi:hypothetical protein
MTRMGQIHAGFIEPMNYTDRNDPIGRIRRIGRIRQAANGDRASYVFTTRPVRALS